MLKSYSLRDVEHGAVGKLGIAVAIVDSHTVATYPTSISSFVDNSELVFERPLGSKGVVKVLTDRFLVIGMNQIAKMHLPGYEIFDGVAGENNEVLAEEYRRAVVINTEAIHSPGNVFDQSRELLCSSENFRLRFYTFRNILDERRIKYFTVELIFGNAHFGWKNVAGAGQAKQLQAAALHVDAFRFRITKAMNLLEVVFAGILRDQHGNFFTNDFFCAVAPHFLAGGVEADNYLPVIDSQYSVSRIFQYLVCLFCRLFQFFGAFFDAVFQFVPGAYQRLVGSFAGHEDEHYAAERQEQRDAENTE